MSEVIPIRIGVSACLLGEEVRYDGGHKCNEFISELLAKHVEFVSVCPEVEFGLGIPRETIELVQIGTDVRLRFTKADRDITDAMHEFAERRVADLSTEKLSGYILKRGSPSCGVRNVKVRHPGGEIQRSGVGLFARSLFSRFPTLPVEEEDRLGDLPTRMAWLSRVLTYHGKEHGGDPGKHQLILDALTC